MTTRAADAHAAWRSLTVADLMSKPVIALPPTRPLRDCDLEMKLSEIHHLPILDDEQRICGIVSTLDVARGLSRPDAARLVVGDVMQTRVRTIGGDMPAYEAAGIILHERIGALPVIGADEHVIGILTASDLVLLAYEVLVGRTPQLPRDSL